MRIAFVTYDIPYPLDAGGKVRAYHLIKQLAKKHQVALFTYYRSPSQMVDLQRLSKYCPTIRVFQRMPAFSWRHLLTSLLHPRLSVHLSHYYHSGLRKALVAELNAGRYDILHLESFYASQLIGRYPSKQILGTENIEWRIYAQHARRQSFCRRTLFSFAAAMTKRYEINTWRKADLILAVSDADARVIQKHTDKPVYTLPNGVDLDYFQFKPRQQNTTAPTVLFVGNFAYIQNQDAALYLAQEILPRIHTAFPRAKLLLVGRKIVGKLAALANNNNNIMVWNDVADIRQAYYAADILLAPLRIGSGTQFKILEAMATGLPVVTTRIGAEGLAAKESVHLAVAEGSVRLAAAALKLIQQARLRNKMVQNARRLVQNRYGWPAVGKQLLQIYRLAREMPVSAKGTVD